MNRLVQDILPAVKEKLPDLTFTMHDITRNGKDKETMLTLSLDDLRSLAEEAAFVDRFDIPLPPVQDDGDSLSIDSGYGSYPPSESEMEPGSSHREDDNPIPSTTLAVARAVKNIIDALHLDKVYDPDRLMDLSDKIAKNLSPAMDDLGLPRNKSTANQFIRLNMFEQYFYLDDSTSMTEGSPSRYELQKETVRRLAPLASRLTGNQMHLRFINQPQNEKFNGLNEVTINAKLEEVQIGGATRIGRGLYRKIVKPLMKKFHDETFDCPVIVTIITDGDVSTLVFMKPLVQ